MGEGSTNPVDFVNKVSERMMNLYMGHHLQEGGVFVHEIQRSTNCCYVGKIAIDTFVQIGTYM